MTNPFKQPSNIWKLELITRYSMIPIFEEYFSNFTDNISYNELSSKTVESKDDDIWSFEAYMEEKPDIIKIKDELQKFILLDNTEWEYQDSLKINRLEEVDWVKKVQENFVPIIVGRFFITNRVNENLCPDDMTKIVIDASMAFGTGEHYTTQGCLEAMELLSVEAFCDIYDIGTGSGILAIIAAKMWKDSLVVASDIEELSVEIAKRHALINDVKITTVLADGLEVIDNNDKSFSKKADLIISNILAVPLINMASSFKNNIKENGFLILSGFLDYQLPSVLEAYIKNGFTPLNIINKNCWITLVMQGKSKQTTLR